MKEPRGIFKLISTKTNSRVSCILLESALLNKILF